jgi:hypothetical protein
VTKDQEAAWRSEFERLGEFLVYENVKQGAIYNDEAKRQAAFRWLSEQAAARRAREEKRPFDTFGGPFSPRQPQRSLD